MNSNMKTVKALVPSAALDDVGSALIDANFRIIVENCKVTNPDGDKTVEIHCGQPLKIPYLHRAAITFAVEEQQLPAAFTAISEGLALRGFEEAEVTVSPLLRFADFENAELPHFRESIE